MDRITAILILLTANSCPAQFGGGGQPPPSDLWTINADGTSLTRVVDAADYTCGSPEWSPDGSLVAYGRWRVDLTDAHIVVIRADGTGARDLGPGAMPNWSPDGKLIVCHTYATGYDTAHIVVMNADGSGRENILNHWGSPRWSRRGNRIVSIYNNNLALFDLATGTERLILRQSYPIYYGFGVSPDGSRFCFSDNRSNLYLATLDEQVGLATVRALAAGKAGYASFAPDGKRVVFSSTPPGEKTHQLYIMDVDANDPPQRLVGQDESRANWGPNWSPDGKRIIFASKARGPQPAQLPATSRESQ